MTQPTQKPRGPRRINGSEILDVAGASAFFGWSDRATYSKVARHARSWAGEAEGNGGDNVKDSRLVRRDEVPSGFALSVWKVPGLGAQNAPYRT